jgi:hypothetical protein
MKTVILAMLLAVCLRASADQFRITAGSGGASHYVAYAEVEVKTSDPPFAGSTDAYGRITIDKLPKGQYIATVFVQGQPVGRVRLFVDSSPLLKDVSLEPTGQ